VVVFILIAMVIFNWLMASRIEKAQDDEKKSKCITAAAIVLDLLPLLVFKLLTTAQIDLPFLVGMREKLPNLSFPLGISFFTFSAISYLVDVNRGELKAEGNLLLFANYVTLFPKLLQGPITQYKAIKDELEDPGTSLADMAEGLRRFITGMAKKVLIADNLAVVVDKVFSQNIPDLSAGLAWYALLAYAVQIYMDFSGYSDMAIGLGRMFGFTLPENFNFPYLSRSVADF
jgi:alginate O-acetyltransferase complex protein AlgI